MPLMKSRTQRVFKNTRDVRSHPKLFRIVKKHKEFASKGVDIQ